MINKIPVTRPFLPPVEEYLTYVKKIYETGILTGLYEASKIVSLRNIET